MSYNQGLKMAQAREAFVKAATASGNLQFIDEFVRRLQSNNSLTCDDIERANGVLRKLRRSTKLKLDDSYNYLDAFSVNMGLFGLMPCESDKDTYLPFQTIVAVRPDMVLHAHRQHPMAFASSAIEHAYSSQTDHTFNWEGQNVYSMVLMGLKLAQLLQDKMMLTGKAACPVILPDENGLMFGHAFLCLAETCDPQITAVSNKRGQEMLRSYKLSEGKADMYFRPQVFVTLRHFIEQTKLNPVQANLFNDYADMLESEAAQNALKALLDTYTVGIKPSPDYACDMDYLDHELASIIGSRTWREATAMADISMRRDLM